jgi:LmbE family N-acetylglucosaminyl deacetylase
MVYREPVSLFLFAHQDDEVGVFQKIIDELQKGHRVCCAYLTDGGFGGVSPQRRCRESLSVLQHLGVNESDVFFSGVDLSIPDGKLHEHLLVAAAWIADWLICFPNVASICVPAWEGGHHDHDALHAMSVCIAESKGILSIVKQFSLYNGYGCVGPFFRVFNPLPMNGELDESRIPWVKRLQFMKYCLSYPSQAITWLGLFPFVFIYYLSNGNQALQSVSIKRIAFRPHEGTLYYESRGFFSWKKMEACLFEWRNNFISKS